MANEEHVARLKQDVAVWNAWCNESRVHGGVVIRGDRTGPGNLNKTISGISA